MLGERTLTLCIHEQFVLVDALRQRQAHLEAIPGMAAEVAALEAIRERLLGARAGAIDELLAEHGAKREAALAPRSYAR